MSNAELGFLLFLILTVGHYAVIWSIYLEKQLVSQPIRDKQISDMCRSCDLSFVFLGWASKQEEKGQEEEDEPETCRWSQVYWSGSDWQVPVWHHPHSSSCLLVRLWFVFFFCSRNQERPHWQDILPLKLSIWLYLSVKNLPQTLQVLQILDGLRSFLRFWWTILTVLFVLFQFVSFDKSEKIMVLWCYQ